jgi:lipopolysaccharide biosynthesis protein
MALNRIVDPPRRGLMRRKLSAISLADRARDAGQWRLAIQFYRQALDQDPDNPPIWVQYGHALKEAGQLRDPDKLSQAELAYRKALALHPGAADSYLQLGHVLKLQGRKEEAEAAYLHAAVLDGSAAEPLRELNALGWSEAQVVELRTLTRPQDAPAAINLNADKARLTGVNGSLSGTPEAEASRAAAISVNITNLFDLRVLQPLGSIAVVLHLYYPEFWEEMRQAIERIPYPFDLFVSLVKGASAQIRPAIMQAFPNAYVFDVENRGRDVGPFLILLNTGVLFRYELVCKLHAKRSMHRQDGDAWRRALTDGILGSSRLIDRIICHFRSDSDLGIVVADGNIGHKDEYWAANDKLLTELLPRAGISPEVSSACFPAGSIFWIRPSLLTGLVRVGFDLNDFEPEPLPLNGALGHAVERMFGLICEDAGLRIIESGRLMEVTQLPCQSEVSTSPRQALRPTSEARVRQPLTPAAPITRPYVHVPDLFELRRLTPRGRIAVVLHLFDPDLWGEMRQAIERILHPFDLFVSLVKGVSDHMRPVITQAFPTSQIFDFENHGRDIGPFLVFLQSGVLYRYDLICKLHTKHSPGYGEDPRRKYQDGDAWRRALIDGVLGSSRLIHQLVTSFNSDPDLGMVVADGNIYSGLECWVSNEKHLSELLPRIGIAPDVRNRSFPGGSIFWIRSFLLRTLAGARLRLEDFEPEPLATDGGLGHSVERMFGIICEDAGMRVVESGQLKEPIQQPPYNSSRVHIIAYYLPQFHPIPENDVWWGTGFTEWTNVTRATPLFPNHRQPRVPMDLGFYDLRLPDVRESQAALARKYGLSAFCYYYYWFDGRRLLERPLDEVLASGRPDFPFMICWANEPWTRNWDGLHADVLLPQTYKLGWVVRFAHDIAPLLRDRRYFRFGGKPMLLIYRIGHIPEAAAAMLELRNTLSEEGISEVHLAAAWVIFPGDTELPADPSALGLDAYFEFPPHGTLRQPPVPLPPGLPEQLGGLYDYNYTLTAALSHLNDQQRGRRHRGVMAGWDNTARTGSRACVFHGATPANFRRWLHGTVSHELRQGGERVVFVNAWNEWAEGTYLEPDQEFGRGWLEAVASATGQRGI